MDLLQQPFAPFVYFARYFSARPQRETWDGQAQRVCFGLIVVRAGTVSVSAPRTRRHLRPGQAGLTEPGMKLGLSPEAEGLLVVWEPLWRQDRRRDRGGAYVVGHGDEPQPSWESLWGDALPLPLPEDWTDSARRLGDGIRHEYGRDEAAHLACNVRLAQWLVRLHRGRDPRSAQADVTGGPLAEQADAIIRERYYQDGGVAAIAEVLRVAPATLSRTYTEHYGYGPREAIERCRLAKAEQLLVESDYAIDRIAHKVGYHSHTAFGRAFRRRHGITPRLWRRRQSLANEA